MVCNSFGISDLAEDLLSDTSLTSLVWPLIRLGIQQERFDGDVRGARDTGRQPERGLVAVPHDPGNRGLRDAYPLGEGPLCGPGGTQVMYEVGIDSVSSHGPKTIRTW